MDFPLIVEAYRQTKAGDALQNSQLVNSQTELESFINRYVGSKIVTKEIESGAMPDVAKQEIIRLIKERVETHDSVSVIKTIKEVLGSYYAVYAPDIESVSSAIIKSDNYIRTKNKNDYFISLNLNKSATKWQTFNNKWTPIIAMAAFGLALYNWFNDAISTKRNQTPTQEWQQRMQTLDSTLQNQQKQIDYILKEKAQTDTAKNDTVKRND